MLTFNPEVDFKSYNIHTLTQFKTILFLINKVILQTHFISRGQHRNDITSIQRKTSCRMIAQCVNGNDWLKLAASLLCP